MSQLSVSMFSEGAVPQALKDALKTVKGDSRWIEVAKAYEVFLDRTEFIGKVLTQLERDDSVEMVEVFDLLNAIRAEERRNLEIRVAMANKDAPTDVTQEHLLNYGELLNEQDAVLRRIALSNCRKYGRVLLQKWHPDKEGGDAEVFNLCKSAIVSGDVELVQILLYRFGEANHVKEFPPERIAEKLRVRTVKFMGSPAYQTFSLYVHSEYGKFLFGLLSLLNKRLLFLKMLNTPGSFNEPLHEEDSDEPEKS